MASSEKRPVISGKDDTPTNPRGIPYAPFVDKVEEYVSSRDEVEPTLRNFQEMISKYQFMEMNLQRRMTGLRDRIPDIRKTLDAVHFLKLRKEEADPIEATFELNDTLYARANIPPTEEVYVWLGANIMLSYPIDEAETLLTSKLSVAKATLSNCEEDLDFLREQITTMEVATARVYNWEVVQKRKDKLEEEAEKKKKKKLKDSDALLRRILAEHVEDMRRNAQKCNTGVGAKAAGAAPTAPSVSGALQVLASQAAVATGHDTGKLSGFDQDNGIFETPAGRQTPRTTAKIGLYRHIPQSLITRNRENNHEIIHHGLPVEFSARRQRREAPIDPADADAIQSALGSLKRPLPSRRHRRAEHNAPALKLRRNKSPSLLLRRVLEPNEHAEDWKIQAAESRSVRLPMILLQMMIRKAASQEPSRNGLLDLLPSSLEWENAMRVVQRSGHSHEDLAYYMYILEGKTDDVRCERFLERDSHKPPFIFHFLLRPSSEFTRLETLSRLIDYCSSWCSEAMRNEPDKSRARAGTPRWALRSTNFNLVMSLLGYHCARLDARLMIKLGDLAVQFIEAVAESSLPQEEIYQTQCSVFNHGLRLFGSGLGIRPIQQSSPNSFFWEAQRILLAVSSRLKRQLLVDAEGFRAIRTVLAGMPKNQVEIHSSVRHASTWPPYLRPGDGMDEEMDPEDSWSRSVRAGMLMQEAGFAKDECDDAVDILQGMSPDGTPTIQQRASLVRRGKLRLWEASIRATRNAQEAWERFQTPPKPGLKLGLAEYTAMFEKLTLREADENTRALPGDRALNFPTPQEANLTEFEKARIRPPSISQLYERMLLDGVRPSGSCLAILVANTESIEMAGKYLHDSDGTGALYRLMSQEMDARALKAVPVSLVSAYIQVMTRQDGKRGRKCMIRAIELAEVRLGLDQTTWSDFIWGTILKNLSQHHRGLRIMVDQQLELSLHVAKKLDGPRGITLSAFIQFNKTVRKIAKRELEQLRSDLELDPSTVGSHALWPLYDEKSRHKDAGQSDTFDDGPGAPGVFRLFRSAALRMNELFDKLVSHERESRRLLGAKRIAPLDEMMWRRDPARSEHAYEYMLSLAYLGEFQQMAKLLRWLVAEWGRPDVVQTLSEMDEQPPYADFLETLCAFRVLAEPMLEQGVVDSLREAIGEAGLNWSWPDNEAMEAYAEMQEDESVNTLARVLERVRLSGDRREKGCREGARKMNGDGVYKPGPS
ncbi:prefoldin subunit 3 [Trichoderma cornu-damae]|uniref:Prefoldin subunit 3 n=1 Tax=Trichoderma cornu-damae TaxID=654480 RepID=A0A9P8TUX6_9HYPO|nr:prefoldin subunit 3 [Trichoderma cornu-damae]